MPITTGERRTTTAHTHTHTHTCTHTHNQQKERNQNIRAEITEKERKETIVKINKTKN